MIHQRSTPVGIDWFIDKLQKAIFDKLTAKWPVGLKYEAYPRCYRNQKDQGYVAEVYTKDKEYADVLWNDTLGALSFFGLSNTPIQFRMGATANIHLIFFVDLDKIFPTSKINPQYRADEEVRKQVVDIIGLGLYGATLNSVEFWKDNVLREYSGSRLNNLIAVDMHPRHCFRLNLTLNYNPSLDCRKKL